MKDLEAIAREVKELFEQEEFISAPQELYEPIDYTLKQGGKRIRPLMLLIANQMFGGDSRLASGAALGIETFHNFTLLHDDLMDKSPLRRGKPTVYTKWDENTAILSGDTMYALAWRYFLRHPHSNLQAILDCFNETGIEVCEGQQYDMNFERREEVTIAEYMAMIRKKTAVLLAGALKIGAMLADAPKEDAERLYDCGIHLGLAFQLQDDLLDAYGDVAVFGKQTGQDIRDRKKTYMILKALEAAGSEREQLKALYAQEEPTDEKVAKVLEAYGRIGVRKMAEEAIDDEFGKTEKALEQVAADEEKKAPLKALMEQLLGRQK